MFAYLVAASAILSWSSCGAKCGSRDVRELCNVDTSQHDRCNKKVNG